MDAIKLETSNSLSSLEKNLKELESSVSNLTNKDEPSANLNDENSGELQKRLNEAILDFTEKLAETD